MLFLLQLWLLSEMGYFYTTTIKDTYTSYIKSSELKSKKKFEVVLVVSTDELQVDWIQTATWYNSNCRVIIFLNKLLYAKVMTLHEYKIKYVVKSYRL